MIALLTGRIVEKEPMSVIMETNGVGYQVNISLHTFSDIKDRKETRLFIHFHVREDAHVLYGFSQLTEKEMFQNLIAVNGIGPNIALMILSCLSTRELYNAIMMENITVLQEVKGIGRKSAQRIILELQDRLKKKPTEDKSKIIGKQHNKVRNEALGALVTLGLSKSAAEKSISSILRKSDKEISLEELVKLALKGG